MKTKHKQLLIEIFVCMSVQRQRLHWIRIRTKIYSYELVWNISFEFVRIEWLHWLQTWSKMDRLSEIEYLTDTPVIKFLLLENLNKRLWVHKYLAPRSGNEEFERSYEELWQNDQKFFEYTRMTPYFRECISPEHKLIVTLRLVECAFAQISDESWWKIKLFVRFEIVVRVRKNF